MNALTNENLHGVEHFFEEFLEVAGLEDLVGVVGTARTIAVAIGLFFEDNVIAVNVFEDGRFVNIPPFEASARELGLGEISADALSLGQICPVQFGPGQIGSPKIGTREVLVRAFESDEQVTNTGILQVAGAQASAIELLDMMPANLDQNSGALTRISKIEVFKRGVGKGCLGQIGAAKSGAP